MCPRSPADTCFCFWNHSFAYFFGIHCIAHKCTETNPNMASTGPHPRLAASPCHLPHPRHPRLSPLGRGSGPWFKALAWPRPALARHCLDLRPYIKIICPLCRFVATGPVVLFTEQKRVLLHAVVDACVFLSTSAETEPCVQLLMRVCVFVFIDLHEAQTNISKCRRHPYNK